MFVSYLVDYRQQGWQGGSGGGGQTLQRGTGTMVPGVIQLAHQVFVLPAQQHSGAVGGRPPLNGQQPDCEPWSASGLVAGSS